MITRNATITAMILLMQAAGPIWVSADLLVEETFDYPADSEVHGLDGGTGWGGAWANTDNPWTVTAPGLAVPGVGIESLYNGITCASTGGNRTSVRDFASTYTSGVVYLGAVLCKNTGGSHYGYLAVVNSFNYGFKIDWHQSEDNWRLFAGGEGANTWGAAVDSGVPIVLGEPILAVLKIDIDTKTVSLYINQATEGTPDCSATGIRFGMLSLSVRGGNNGSSSVDAIRVGTTYADVAAIPIIPPPTIVMIR